MAALVRDQLCIVVGPLLSLARDQAVKLQALGIEARTISHKVAPINNPNL